MESLGTHCQREVFPVLHPAKVQDQLGRHLSLIDGGAGTLKTILEGVEKVRLHIAAGTRVLCDAPTVLARQNLVRALHVAFPGQVRVVGQSRLSELELTLTLEARIGSDMKGSLFGMFVSAGVLTTIVPNILTTLPNILGLCDLVKRLKLCL